MRHRRLKGFLMKLSTCLNCIRYTGQGHISAGLEYGLEWLESYYACFRAYRWLFRSYHIFTGMCIMHKFYEWFSDAHILSFGGIAIALHDYLKRIQLWVVSYFFIWPIYNFAWPATSSGWKLPMHTYQSSIRSKITPFGKLWIRSK